MRYYHVTAIRHGDVYGHATTHCDPAGCAGDELFLGTVEELKGAVADEEGVLRRGATVDTDLVTDEQIHALLTEASNAGDGEQVVICERALTVDAEWDTDDWTGGGERPEFYRRLRDMSQTDARAECEQLLLRSKEGE